ncbi:MAG: GAF domain-containing protein [Thermoleophilia bacterium]|nr:GAF domain-containing protein [Thermoleophilia bacterium]
MRQSEVAGNELADQAADHVLGLPPDYYHETLAQIADALELICGCRHIRLMLAQPWFYGSVTPEILGTAYVRGLRLSPQPLQPIWLDRPHLKRDGVESAFVAAETSDAGRCFLKGETIKSDHRSSPEQEPAGLHSLGLGFSLYLPIADESGPVGVAALDFSHAPDTAHLADMENAAVHFLTRVAPQLRIVEGYRRDRILSERTIDRMLRRQRTYLLLRNLVKTGPTDLAVALTTDPFLLTANGELPPCSTSSEAQTFFWVEAYSNDKQDKFALEEAVSRRRLIEIVSDNDGSSRDSQVSYQGDGAQLTDIALSLKTPSGPHPITAAWMRQVLPDYTHYLRYPLTKQEDATPVGLVLLYLKAGTIAELTESGIGPFTQFPNLQTVARDLVSLMVEPVSTNLVMDRVLSVYHLREAYEEYDGIKNIKEALSLYLHEALTHLAGAADADYGTVGVVNTLDERPYVVVEKDTGEIVGAKVGDLQDLRVPALAVGDPGSLLSAEFSISGATAGTGKTTIADDLEQVAAPGARREFRSDVRSAIAIPISTTGAPVAVITLSSPRKAHFTPQTRTILESMTAMLATPIDNLIKKHKVAEASIRLYGGRYPYIDNDALRALADLYYAGSVKLAPFMDEVLVTRNRRRAESPSTTAHVTLEDVERTFWQMSIDVSDLEDYIDNADREIAESLYRLLKGRKVTFQAAVQQRYTNHRLSRNVVRTVIALAQEELGKPQMTRVAMLLNVCSPDYRGNPEERKKIEQFRQFYYRTVGAKPEE